jgi:predicted transcriptional regulator
VNDIQELIGQLREKGWTLSAVADEMGVSRNAVDLWRSGSRYPTNVLAVKHELERLLVRKRIPKRKRYKQTEDKE